MTKNTTSHQSEYGHITSLIRMTHRLILSLFGLRAFILFSTSLPPTKASSYTSPPQLPLFDTTLSHQPLFHQTVLEVRSQKVHFVGGNTQEPHRSECVNNYILSTNVAVSKPLDGGSRNATPLPMIPRRLT
jgi:hypothetical protein